MCRITVVLPSRIIGVVWCEICRDLFGACPVGGPTNWKDRHLVIQGAGKKRPATALDPEAAELAFDTLYGNCAQPSFLTNEQGRILARNHSASILDDESEYLGDAFRTRVPEVDRVLYQLGNKAKDQGIAESRVQGLTGQDRIGVQYLSESQLIWSFNRVGGDLNADRDEVEPAIGLEHVPVAIALLAPDGRILFANAATRDLLKISASETYLLGDLVEGLAKPVSTRLADTMAGRAQGRSEVAKGRLVDGFLQLTMTRVGDEGHHRILAVLSDATELKTLEAQFIQSQKMQAVGQLAGGIAHDFNNLLTAIHGHCDLLLLRHVQGDSDYPDLMQIRHNANRAASLVGQLLAFSRKQTLRPQVLNIFETLSELANLLNRLLGERIELILHNTEDIWPVRVDERQLEQVVVNLVVNARDAMSDGGEVTIRTRKLELDAPIERSRATIPAGRYAIIEVQDHGHGIAADKIDKVFEPFFTTKKVGEGTGLGLSTAYGIIKQMEGFIFLESKMGEGTTFSVYLPASEQDGEKAPKVEKRESVPITDSTGEGCVLLVEDEAPVRSFACRALQIRGYTVIEACSGEEALEILSDPELKVDLFVSDVVMPGLDGPGWVEKAREMRPDISTIFVSGYSQDTFSDGRSVVPMSSYLPKPFTLNDLTERVRDHFDRFVPKTLDD